MKSYFILYSMVCSLTVFAQAHRKAPLRAIPVQEAAPAAKKIIQSKYYLIVKPEWDENDENEFSKFVQALGESSCKNMEECLRGPANPYRSTDPEELRFFADCADFPYMLRAYFAWKKGLPFSIASGLNSSDPLPAPGEPPRDIRYSKSGNTIAARKDYSTQAVYNDQGQFIGGRHITLDEMWHHAENILSTAMYRTDPRKENPKMFSDFYSPSINRDNIRPGTVLYAPHGHAAIVSRVEPNGDVHILQAGIDGNISRIVFNKTSFPQSRPEHGAGFKNWRPQRLVGAFKNDHGIYIGGKIEGMTDDELRKKGHFSLEQYQRTQGKFEHNGQLLSWDEFVNAKLSLTPWVRDPIKDFEKRLGALCSQAKARVDSVSLAYERGLPQQVHPIKLPQNIFGSVDQPEWETFSSPGRDANMREMMSDLVSYVKDHAAMSAKDLKKTAYQGTDIVKDLGLAFEKANASCKFSYKNSNGKNVSLDLAKMFDRATKISFDPYHCPELRWGAEGDELKSCSQDSSSTRWYQVQAPLRTMTYRDTSGFHGFSLEESQAELMKFMNRGDFDLSKVLRE